MTCKDTVMPEEVVDWLRTGYCDVCVDQSACLTTTSSTQGVSVHSTPCGGCYVKEAIDRVLWLECQRQYTNGGGA